MYGRAEAVLGALLAGTPDAERTFIATKVWTRGRQVGIKQMERSFALLVCAAGRVELEGFSPWAAGDALSCFSALQALACSVAARVMERKVYRRMAA